MRTLVVLQIDHPKPNPVLAELIASRAWSLDGVESAYVVQVQRLDESGPLPDFVSIDLSHLAHEP